jgi:hypothetical protein
MAADMSDKAPHADRGRSANKPVTVATLALIGAGALHDLDHLLNQPHRSFNPEVFALAGLGWLALFVTLYLAYRDHRLAPLFALTTGLGTAVGLVAVHIVPDFSAISDSYVGLGVNAASWVSVGILMTVSLVLAFVGGSQLLQRRNEALSSPAQA